MSLSYLLVAPDIPYEWQRVNETVHLLSRLVCLLMAGEDREMKKRNLPVTVHRSHQQHNGFNTAYNRVLFFSLCTLKTVLKESRAFSQMRLPHFCCC